MSNKNSITDNDASTIIEMIEDIYVNEELGEYDGVEDLIGHLKLGFPHLFCEGDICCNILIK